jgi:DNA-binding response OmpR family regulator
MPKKRLLVIEDDIDVAEMLIVYFSGQGYEVFNAMSGREGISMARSRFPNLILLDVMLPDMDGFDVCLSLRTTTLTKNIPTIFLTQRDRRADKVRGLELGADDYITKPFDMEELRLRVQGSLKRSGREQLQDPHTSLPTSPVLIAEEQRLAEVQGWTKLNVQLLGFLAFRDVYGFVASDEALTFIGQVITETITDTGTSEDFAGMQDDQNYVIFTFTPDVNAFCEKLNKRFSEGVQAFYNFQDTERGFVTLNEGLADEQHVPLMHFLITQTTATPKPSSA